MFRSPLYEEYRIFEIVMSHRKYRNTQKRVPLEAAPVTMLMIVLHHLPEIVFLSPDQTIVEPGDNGTILKFEWQKGIMMGYRPLSI